MGHETTSWKTAGLIMAIIVWTAGFGAADEAVTAKWPDSVTVKGQILEGQITRLDAGGIQFGTAFGRGTIRISYGDLQWQDTGERLTAESFARYRETGGTVIIHLMKPEWIEMWLQAPFVIVASDGMPYAPGAHPRSAGTFTRVLGRYARDQEMLPLMEAISGLN